MKTDDIVKKIKEITDDTVETRVNQRLQIFETLYRDQSKKNDARDEIINQIHEKLTIVEKIANDSLTQGLKTNGSVRDLKNWRAWITGTIGMFGIVSALITYIYMTDKKIDNEIIIGMQADHKSLTADISSIKLDLARHEIETSKLIK